VSSRSEKDDAQLSERIAEALGLAFFLAPFVLEGGSSFVDGEGAANHYLANGAVIVPVGGDRGDGPALDRLREVYPERDVVGVPGEILAFGGGGPHCITQQIPADVELPT
jgi:agmatine/peptidylarginine deiminase